MIVIVLFQANVGDQESVQAVIIQRDRSKIARGKALAEYNTAFSAVNDFDERARRWVDLSNLKELTPDEKAIFDSVSLTICAFSIVNCEFRSPRRFPITPSRPLVTPSKIPPLVLTLIAHPWRRITMRNLKPSLLPRPVTSMLLIRPRRTRIALKPLPVDLVAALLIRTEV